MTRRIALWSLAGFIVACVWVLFVDALTPASRVEILRSRALWALIEITAPVAWCARHLALKYYWFVLLNAAAYSVLGLGVELLRRSPRHASAS